MALEERLIDRDIFEPTPSLTIVGTTEQSIDKQHRITMGEVLENLFDVQGASNLGDISQTSDYLFCPTAGREWLVTCDPNDRQVNWIVHYYHRKLKTKPCRVRIYRPKNLPFPFSQPFLIFRLKPKIRATCRKHVMIPAGSPVWLLPMRCFRFHRIAKPVVANIRQNS